MKNTLRIFFAISCGLSLLGVTTPVHASPEVDRMYSLDSIGWLKPVDNIDGILNDFVDEIYEEYFKAQSRFQAKNLNQASNLLSQSKVPYYQWVKDPEILRGIARKNKVESILRTKIAKESESYRFEIEWVYAPRGDVFAKAEFRFYDPQAEAGLRGSELPQFLKKCLDDVIKKLPFIGQVTGVEDQVITVNFGRNQGLRVRDTLVLSTLDAVKRHPLDRTIEEWSWSPIGKAQVEQVEESIAFAKVVDLNAEQKPLPFQKVREIIPAPPEQKKPNADGEFVVSENEPPRIGWVAGNIGGGFYSREVGLPGGTTGRTGSGLLGAFELDSMAWMNSRWMAQLSLMSSLYSYAPKDLATQIAIGTKYSGSATQLRIATGYALYKANSVFDPIGWVLVGYRNTNYSLATNAADYTGGSSMGSLFLGLGGELPVRDLFTAQVGFDIGLIKSHSQDNPNFGSATSVSDLAFYLGGVVQHSERIFLRLLFKLNAQSAEFATGESVSQKMISLSPSILYYF